ncbi:unnamed protein product [Cylicocyclus nassatus]|uniref:Ig-like domain-containing protein n=1 Tax=Cylicocyclus nassatus TaxID=53992 RepID=A0AA36GVG4_CYLNA|nr:unnamed protein product [Cylicocyclus nassatus]
MLLGCFFISAIFYSVGAFWTQIKLDPVLWEELPQTEENERILSCHNYEPQTKHRYHWRFNGSSVLPKEVEVRRGKLVFNRKLHAYRNLVVGEYSCCIHESLGKACYTQQLLIRDPPQHVGIDLSKAQKLHAKLGDSYDIRLSDTKDYDEVHCKFNNQTIPSNVQYFKSKDKRGKYYQIRIRHFMQENVGQYACLLKLKEKEIVSKEFAATLEPDPVSSSSSFLSSIYYALLLFAFACMYITV